MAETLGSRPRFLNWLVGSRDCETTCLTFVTRIQWLFLNERNHAYGKLRTKRVSLFYYTQIRLSREALTTLINCSLIRMRLWLLTAGVVRSASASSRFRAFTLSGVKHHKGFAKSTTATAYQKEQPGGLADSTLKTSRYLGMAYAGELRTSNDKF